MRNLHLLAETLDYLEQHPEEWDQNEAVPICGNRCCVFGHLFFHAGNKLPKNTHRYYGMKLVMDHARHLLGLDLTTTSYLFQPERTLEDFRNFLRLGGIPGKTKLTDKVFSEGAIDAY